MCGSSQQAVHFAAQAVAAGDMDYAIGCGVENMTRVPMFLDISLGREGVHGFEVLNPALFDKHELIHQGESAERIADKWGFSRRDVDEFAKEPFPSLSRRSRPAPTKRPSRLCSEFERILGSSTRFIPYT